MQYTILLLSGDTATIIAFWEKNVNPQKSGFRWVSFTHREDGTVSCGIVNRLFFCKVLFWTLCANFAEKEYAFHPIPI